MRAIVIIVAVLTVVIVPSSGAQFREDFDGPTLKLDPSGVKGWAFFTGEGRVVMNFRQEEAGYASLLVDATEDRRNVWWALIKHKVSDGMDLSLLKKPGYELRVEARVRASHAPRRINLHVNTQKTTDFHSHLMEFDIPDTENWHTVSMTTRGFSAEPGDTVYGQLAIMDWGLGIYRLDVDYFCVDIIEAALAGPDLGEAVAYHPPLADPAGFRFVLKAVQASTVDLENVDINFGRWTVFDAGGKADVITAGGSRFIILRWDLSALKGKKAIGKGLLELTTRAVERTAEEIPDFGLIRVVEILGGDPHWEKRTVTFSSLSGGLHLDQVLNPQMVIDWPVTEGDGKKTYLTVPRPVLQRLLEGKTLGLAIRPLGAINASFYSTDGEHGTCGPRLRLNIRD
ncbi:MAG: hypothetical protein QHH14_03395 [Clostridiales bacterium]|nr:hypothetical protein [Clostridiales bacterium]